MRFVIVTALLALTSVAQADLRWDAVNSFEVARKDAFDLRQKLEPIQPLVPNEVNACYRLIDEFLVRSARVQVGMLRMKIGHPDPAVEAETKECLALSDRIQSHGVRVIQALGKPKPEPGENVDSWVDTQVEKNWRPLPGGNSKEDAKILTKAIMRAKSLEELDSILDEQSRAGR